MRPGLHLFETAIGPAAMAWTSKGVSGFQLPERTGAATLARLAGRQPATVAAPPPIVAEAVRRAVALIEGGFVSFDDIPLDFGDAPAFDRSVFDVARGIPPGETMTYGEVAGRLGDPGLARAVGGALGRNPIPLIVPCHRVTAAGRSDRRLLGARRRRDEAAAPRHRGRSCGARPSLVRRAITCSVMNS